MQAAIVALKGGCDWGPSPNTVCQLIQCPQAITHFPEMPQVKHVGNVTLGGW